MSKKASFADDGIGRWGPWTWRGVCTCSGWGGAGLVSRSLLGLSVAPEREKLAHDLIATGKYDRKAIK